MIDAEEYNQFISKFRVLDCAVGKDGVLCFLLVEDQTQWPNYKDGDKLLDYQSLEQRVITFNPDQTQKKSKWSVEKINGCDRMIVGHTLQPHASFLAMSITGDTYSISNNQVIKESTLAYDINAMRSIITRIALIGEATYVCGDERLVGLRSDMMQWQWLTQNVPFDFEAGKAHGFQDIDGFNEQDIYAVGGYGDVWHYHSNKWRQIDFPTDDIIKRVCCAGNGLVYISDYECGLYEGRRDQWKKVAEPELSLSFKDIVWYRNSLWCTSDYGLWRFHGGEFIEADINHDVKACSGHLSVYEDTLLLAGYYGAAYLKDGKWEVLFHS